MQRQQPDRVMDAGRLIIRDLSHTLQAPDSNDPQGIHRLRVAIKQLRALLRLYQPHHGKAAFHTLDQSLKQLAQRFGDTRDAEVRIQTLRKLASKQPKRCLARIAPLLDRAQSQRPAVGSPDTRASTEAALVALEAIWQNNLPALQDADVAEGLAFSFHKCRKLATRCRASNDIEVYHRCRRWLKTQQYQLELALPALNKKQKAQHRRVKKLASRIGDLHDCYMLEHYLVDLLAQTPTSEEHAATEQALIWCRQEVKALRRACDKRLKKLFKKNQQ